MKWKKYLAVVFALCSILNSVPAYAQNETADASEEEKVQEQWTEEAEGSLSIPEQMRLAGEEPHSWRFDDDFWNGIMPLDSTGVEGAWEWNGEYYINSQGERIPNVVMRGMDVSRWQGTIDWDTVAVEGDIDFVIIRSAHGGISTDSSRYYVDVNWETNADACTRLGLPFSTYIYGLATTPEEAVQEAETVLKLVEGYNISLPIYYDLEDDSIVTALEGEPAKYAAIAKAFCDTIKEAGYTPGIYANTYWWNTYLTDDVFKSSGWHKWIARYAPSIDYLSENQTWNQMFVEDENYIWQCSSTNTVPGITANTVYIDFLIDTAIDNAEVFQRRVPTVTNVEFDSDSKAVLVEWTDILNEEGYAVYRKEGEEETWVKIDQVDANINSYLDTTAEAGRTYYYAIKGVRNCSGVLTETNYTSSTACTIPANTVTYTIVFDGNGGSGSMENQTVTYGVNSTLRANAFTRANYTFMGWVAYRTSDQKWYTDNGWKTETEINTDGDTKYLYLDQTIISNDSSVNNDTVIMYAQWTIAVSKKGIQGLESLDIPELGISHIFLNLNVAEIISSSAQVGWKPFTVNNKIYYFNEDYFYTRINLFENAREKGVYKIYVQIMSTEMEGLTDTTSSSAIYHAFDTWTTSGVALVTKAFEMIGEYWGSYIDYWILGNEVNDQHQYYEMGTSSLDTYVTNYEKAMRLCYNTMKTYNSNVGVFVCVDHEWMATGTRFSTKELLTQLAAKTKEGGDYNWGVACHPFPEPLSSSNWWDDEASGATNSENAEKITLYNFNVFTSFMQNSNMLYNNEVRMIVITECGFNAYENGVENQTMQAASFARAYYLIEANPYVSGFIIRAIRDAEAEIAQGLYLGLMDISDNPREIYDVFQYIDTPQGISKTDKYLDYFGVSSWSELISNDNLPKEEEPVIYVVHFDGNGGSGSMASQSVTYGVNSTLQANAFTRTGYTFQGWYAYRASDSKWYTTSGWKTQAEIDAGGYTKYLYKNQATVAKTSSVNNDTVTMYAQWTANTYTVVFNGNGGSGSMENQTVTYGVNSTLRANAFTRAGYLFQGWYAYRASDSKWYTTSGWKTQAEINAGGYTKYLYKNQATVAKTSSVNHDTVTMYAQWIVNPTYTVVFNANGGSGSMANQSVTYGVNSTLRANAFIRTGYTFKGWYAYRASDSKWYTTSGWKTQAEINAGGYTKYLYKNQATVAKTSSVNNDTVTMYAQWTANTYTVVFNANGGSGSMANQTVTYGVNSTLRANAFTRTGYTFKGWYAYRASDSKWYTTSGWKTQAEINAGGYTKYLYKNQATVAKTSSVNKDTVTMYAQWTANTYTVVFNANGGSGSMANQTVTYGVNSTLRANAFTRTGYTFKGWYAYRASDSKWYTTSGWKTQAEINAGGYTKYLYKNQATVAKTSSVNKDTVTMYAQWTANTYTVVFNANGGSGSMANQTVTYGVNSTLRANAFTRTGYTFKGWYAYRASDSKWYTTSGWKTQAEINAGGYTKYLYKNQATVAKTSSVNKDIVTMYAQWGR